MTIIKRITKAVGILFGFEDEEVDRTAKMEAQRITEFSGRFDEWTTWKTRTRCAFEAAGYGNILEEEAMARKYPKRNAIVYAQLSVALSGGTAHHIIIRYDSQRDGFAAWRAITEWFEGEDMVYEQADKYREVLNNLKLRPGGSAQEYINKFMTTIDKLGRIPGEEMSSISQAQHFLRNIIDDEYKL
jgi:hypothetical protein